MSQILIVEDEPRIAAFLEKGLQKHGYQTTVVGDGEQATALIQQQRFDLILLDIGLPIKDGWAVLEEMNQMPKTDLPNVIILSARADDSDRQHSLRLGAKDYITKPFRFNELLHRVKAVLMAQLPVGAIFAVTSLLS
jgi:DNA-binding response OmpR family regulator